MSAPVGKTFCEQMEMLRDDFARYSDGDPKVPFVVVREALVAALNEWDALAQQPAAVDEAMVERAFDAWCGVADVDEWRVRNAHEALRAALTAALAMQGGDT